MSERWLSQLNGEQFAIGAHGHEHQRFSMMTADQQYNNLRKNLEVLRQFQTFRRIFAVPFGRAYDWNRDTIEIARELDLAVVLGDGGINHQPCTTEFIRRIAADNRLLQPLLRREMASA